MPQPNQNRSSWSERVMPPHIVDADPHATAKGPILQDYLPLERRAPPPAAHPKPLLHP